jgi:SAM-dependent methyltransferase
LNPLDVKTPSWPRRDEQVVRTPWISRKSCRYCLGAVLKKVLDLGEMPLAGGFIRPEEIPAEQRFPLRLFVCEDCHGAQILDVIPREVLFRDYRYLSSTTKTLRTHFETLAQELFREFLGPGGRVVEIGSNDGVLLRPLLKLGVSAVGVDPALNVAARARDEGLTVIPDFFTEKVATKILENIGPVDAVCANNVLAHIDDLDEVFRGVRKLLKPEGILVFEVHYLVDLLQGLQYDTIYHEHLMYHWLGPLARLLDRHGLSAFRVKRIPIHGGSIRVYAGSSDPWGSRVENSVAALRDLEQSLQLPDGKAFAGFAEDVERHRADFRLALKAHKDGGGRIAGYGASGRSSILLNACHIGSDLMEFVVDESQERLGRLTPGVHLPIVPRSKLVEERIDLAVMFAWNYEHEILEKESEYRRQGGKFLIPLPRIRTI